MRKVVACSVAAADASVTKVWVDGGYRSSMVAAGVLRELRSFGGYERNGPVTS